MTDQRTEVVILNIGEARNLTNEVKLDAVWLWRKLLRLYRGGAHTLLGYSSWAEYCAEEFDMGKSQAYRLLDSGRVMESLDESQMGNGLLPKLLRENWFPLYEGIRSGSWRFGVRSWSDMDRRRPLHR